MPDITLLSSEMPVLLPMQGRSEGIHVSSVIHDLCIRMGMYEERDPNIALFEVGNALEWAMIERRHRHDPERYIIPGELEKEGVFGHPDLVDIDVDVIEEIKATWMSVRHGPESEKFWKYERQMMSYCWMWETVKSVLNVTFVNGDYKGSGPQHREWGYEWKESELAENWQMIKRHGELMMKEGRL